jgi:inosose dehydratase
MVHVVRELAAMKFHGIEAFGLLEPLGADKDLPRVLSENCVKLSGTYFAGSFVEPEWLEAESTRFERTVAETVKLGGKYVFTGGGRIRAGKVEQDWKTFVQSMARLAQTAMSRGGRMVFHPHHGTLVCAPEEIKRLAEETDPQLVRFGFDIAHLARGGGDPLALFRQYIDRLDYVHLKDLKGDTFVELGQGTLPIPEVYRVLCDHGYDGWIVVELDETPDALASAKRNLAYLRDVLGCSL